jgi:hypothetical protein
LVLAESTGKKEGYLVYDGEYHRGDAIVLQVENVPAYYWVQLDDARERSLVYITGEVRYEIPFDEARNNISLNAFKGNKHLLFARQAREFELENYRNLALNVWDQHGISTMYPHAWANVETRGESVFAAQNAIDGVTLNCSHGEWPYASWGINRQDDARIRIDFGREVTVDRLILYTRADFPHDNWWEQVSFTFSDGSEIKWSLEKSDKPHEMQFPPKHISWLEMHDMKKADDPSPFPALTQLEVYGK